MPELHLVTHAGPQALATFEAAQPDAPVVVCLPALGIDAGYYTPLAQALASGGAHAVLADFPGRGASPLHASRDCDWGHAELVGHCRAISELVRASFTSSQFYWLGHSLGGHVALMHAGTYADRVDGVVLVASGTPWHGSWVGLERARILAATQTLGLAARVFGYVPGKRLGLGANEPRTLIGEWAYAARHGRYPAGTFDAEAAMSACDRPVLSIALDGDRLAPPRAIEHNLAKLRSMQIERWTWHPEPPLTHNRWPRKPAGAAERVMQWLRGRAALRGQASSGSCR